MLPLVGRRLPIIADDYVDPEFGTGALKITPGPRPERLRDRPPATGSRRSRVIGEDGRITDAAAERFRGHGRRRGARRRWWPRCASRGSLSGTEPYVHDVPHSHRSGRRIEPLISLQWFCDMDELAEPAIEAVRDGQHALPPGAALDERLPELAREHPALVHLAPALVGPPAPGLVLAARRPTWASRAAGRRRLGARPRRARHLVLVRRSGRSRRSAGRRRRDELRAFYPTDVNSTARDIIFLWVARMVMFGMS